MGKIRSAQGDEDGGGGSELESLDEEIRKRDEAIKHKLEDGMGTITEWMKDLEDRFMRREAEVRRQAEMEFDRKLDEMQARMDADMRKRDDRIAKLEEEYDKKIAELRRKFDSDLRKKDEELLQLVEKKNLEKEAAMLEVYRIIEAQSDILSKIMERNEKLLLEVLNELDISIEDLRKMLETSPT